MNTGACRKTAPVFFCAVFAAAAAFLVHAVLFGALFFLTGAGIVSNMAITESGKQNGFLGKTSIKTKIGEAVRPSCCQVPAVRCYEEESHAA